MADAPLVEVRELRKWYPLRRGLGLPSAGTARARHLKAVDGVSFSLRHGEILGIAGESGCGKSTAGMTLLKLLEPTGGEIHFDGNDITAQHGQSALRRFRRSAQIVFQNPYESLNPRFTVNDSVREPAAIHFRESRADLRARVIKALTRAGLTPAESFLDRFPHELSGGQLQRIAIARAIVVEPRFLVADEPVSMLDVSIRAGILNLLRRFAAELDMAVLYISHDLSTMRHVAHRVAIMYLGRIVEIGPATRILDEPLHPYAKALIASVPLLRTKRAARAVLEGPPPNPADPPLGCAFHPRCPSAMPVCREREPVLVAADADHSAACHLVQ